MSYRCVKELKVEATTIPVGTAIEPDYGTDFVGKAFVTSETGCYHYAVLDDMFKEHFEGVES